MPVPNIFGTATSAIPLSQLDTNFATPVTIGNTAVQLGNTVTSFGNVTLTNVTISSGNVIVTGANVSGTANVSTLVVTGNQTSLGNVAITGNISANIATFGAGSNTAPSITTTGDTNTGIFFPAADTIAFSEGGTEAMRIDSSGNVGIGTSSPNTTAANRVVLEINGTTDALLNISGGGTRRATLYANSTDCVFGSITSIPLEFLTGGVERMRIDSSGNLLFNSGYGSVATAYGCRAWVNFNGTGTPAIRGSGNVSSITDGGTGTFTVNFTTSMPDQNYSAVGSAVNSTSSLVGITAAGGIQTPYFEIRVTNDAGSLQDPNFCCYAVFR